MAPPRRDSAEDPAASFRAGLFRDLEQYVLDGLEPSSGELLEHLETLSWDRLENTIDRILLGELRAVGLLQELEQAERLPLGIGAAIATEIAAAPPSGELRAPALRNGSAARLETWFARILGTLVHGLLIEFGDLRLAVTAEHTLDLELRSGQDPGWNVDATPAERSAELSALLLERLGVSLPPSREGGGLRLSLPNWAFSPA